MERQLDLISNNKIENWNIICSNCYNELKELSKSIKDVKKQIIICDGYEFIFEIRTCNQTYIRRWKY